MGQPSPAVLTKEQRKAARENLAHQAVEAAKRVRGLPKESRPQLGPAANAAYGVLVGNGTEQAAYHAALACIS